MDWYKALTENTVAGNRLWQWVVFALLVLAGLAVGKLVRTFLERLAGRCENQERRPMLGTLCRCVARPAAVLALAIAVSVGLLVVLTLDERLQPFAEAVSRVLVTTAVGYLVYRLVDVMDRYLSGFAGRTENKLDDMLVPLVGKSVRVTVAVLVVIQVAEVVIGGPLTTILAGLGVGGLAVALAGKDTIRNFFGSLVILGDKPFQVADRVVIDGHDGFVETVGFRSTKLRRLDGSLVSIPNGDLVDKSIENISSRPSIKRVANITVTYDTSPDKLREAVAIVKDVLADHEGMDPEFPPRVYFSEFDDCSLNIVVYYWYHPPEWWPYLAFSERVNFEILERFNKAGIEFAFPTQTVFLANDDRRQLAVRLLGGEQGGGVA